MGFCLRLGIVVLAMSRPYEGLLLCLPVAVVLGRWILFGKNRPAPALLIRRAALPLAVLVAGAAWMADYDYHAFGNPLTLPYTINRATYAVAPYWIWQSVRPEPAYRHPVMRDYYVKQELPVVTLYRNAEGFVVQNLYKPVSTLRFYAGIALLPPLLMLLSTLRDRRTRFLVVGVVVLAAGMFLEIVLLPHYVAPFTVAFYAIGLQCMRHLRLWSPAGRPVGLGIVRALVVICVAMAALRAWAMPLNLQPSRLAARKRGLQTGMGRASLAWPGHALLPSWSDSRENSLFSFATPRTITRFGSGSITQPTSRTRR